MNIPGAYVQPGDIGKKNKGNPDNEEDLKNWIFPVQKGLADLSDRRKKESHKIAQYFRKKT